MENYTWWKHGIIYHLYVRSFYDSNGDGIGDIQGVVEKLDYLKELGVTGVWLSPIFKSPMVDFGYDISDYRNVDPEYGTKDDLKHLLAEAHKRDIRMIMDIALNHTSDQHPWFLESRSSLENSKRNWYIWRRGKIIGPPNNWITGLFESAWAYDKKTNEYYLHSFLKNQPDLNWRNPEVEKEMLDTLNYWMEFGFDGFRLDMINWLIKDEEMKDNPNFMFFKLFQKQIHNKNQKHISPVLGLIRKTVDAFPDKVTIGEVFTMPPGDPELSAFYLGNGQNSLNLAFDFSLMYRYWNARSIFKTIRKWIQSIPVSAWPCHVLSNHDQLRSFTRLCRGPDGFKKAGLLATMLLTLPGTPFLYYGEEIGMKNFKLRKNEIVDPIGKKFWPFFKGRDTSRSPMQWDDSFNGGFSSALETWLPLNPDFKNNNLKEHQKNPDSLYNQYKKIIALRNKEKALQKGVWEVVQNGRNGIIGYSRRTGEESLLVFLNFKSVPKKLPWQVIGKWNIVFSTHRNSEETIRNESIELFPFEGLILKMVI